MRALIQRVTEASVYVGQEVAGEIGDGLVVLIGVGRGDSESDIRFVVDKCINLRIFSRSDGRFDRSALDVGADLLIISQFTLYADISRGRRPSFTDAVSSSVAEPIFNQTVDAFRKTGLKVEEGQFQKHMVVSINNDGPVTIMVDSRARNSP